MAKNESISVKDAVHKLQLSLLEGIKNEDQLFAAGSLISRSDYEDVVTERSIAIMCGYPLCCNPLPADRVRKGRYRISLKEHKVYDLQETYLYCSTSCVVNSRTFAESLQEERCAVLNSAQLNEILHLFEDLNLESKDGLGKNGDLGLSELRIQEKANVRGGEVSLEEWIGPSNAIEGYVPQRDCSIKPSHPKIQKEGSKQTDVKPNKGKDMIFNDMDFTSTIITQDEYSISKTLAGSEATVSCAKSEELKKMENKLTILEMPAQVQSDSKSKTLESKAKKITTVDEDKVAISKISSHLSQNCPSINASVEKEESFDVKADHGSEAMLKTSLKSAGAKKQPRSVTWADERNNSADNRNLCEVRELEDTKEFSDKFSLPTSGDDSDSVRFASAEACAIALCEAAEAVAGGEFDASDAVSEAGIIVLPPLHDVDEEVCQEDGDMLEIEPTLKWPTKPGVPNYNLFDSEDSWFDSPPERFSLILSPFATMWNTLFQWISSSSLAYVYGREDSFHEDYLSVSGREYPRKIVVGDGRSSEIKQTLAGCLARALPGLVADLRLPTPISTVEQGMARLLDTMSFIDPLPPFRMKQWQVIVLLFIDALSVSRIPALTPHITSCRTLLHKGQHVQSHKLRSVCYFDSTQLNKSSSKLLQFLGTTSQVLDGAQISMEEYEMMKDFVIPLG